MNDECECINCIRKRNEKGAGGLPLEWTRMIVCSVCGNKRCPHATNHEYACTHSNDPGQPGSFYE